jgi:patatin-like phospholipase/acyl hydrolase
LSIDGGGIRGVLPAAFLSELESRYLGGASIGAYFDLLTGTSTGGIIVLGLASGMTAVAIQAFYTDHGREIFPSVSGRFRRIKQRIKCLRSFARYQYDRAPLERHLRLAFQRKTIGELSRRICVPAFDGRTETHVFKTPHHPDFRIDWHEELVTAGLATSAAPSFFSVYQSGDRKFADGGVWANNPIMIGLVEALASYDLERENIEILSLGCGEEQMEISREQISKGGLYYWRNIMSAAMHLSGQNALGQAGLLIGRDRILRVDATLANAIRLDDAEMAIRDLPGVAEILADDFGQRVAGTFLTEPAQTYRAFHGPRA